MRSDSINPKETVRTDRPQRQPLKLPSSAPHPSIALAFTPATVSVSPKVFHGIGINAPNPYVNSIG
jgi:hypothetical protein